MPTSASSWAKPVSLLPFGYFAITRLRGARDYGYLIASSWIPAIWFLYRSSGSSLVDAALSFAAGYLAFIALYEIGYLANDAWDARKSCSGRQRIPFRIGPGYATGFTLVRILAWLVIGLATGWLFDPVWIAGFAVLIVVFAQHNIITARGLRGASFFQLATLRFALPVIGATPPESRLLLVVASLIFYTYFRFLSYLDSKDLLQMPDRRRGDFGLLQTVMLSPLSLFVALLSSTTLVIELLAYFVVVYLIWQQAKAGAPDEATKVSTR